MKEIPTSEIDDLKKKLEENPESLVFAPLADVYRKQGNLEEAFNVCKKGLEKHPSYTSARVVLGRIYQDQKKMEDAASEFRKVLEVDPENLMAHSLLGSLLMAKKDYQAAIEEYQKILTLNPDDEETQSSLRQAIEQAAGDQKSEKNPKKEPSVPEKKPTPKDTTATLTIAELYLKQGHFDKAVEVYQELLVKDPQNLMLRQKLNEIIDRRQKDQTSETQTKLKKSDFVRPPDQKEDLLDEASSEAKTLQKAKKDDDSKFTSEDILQVMRRGGKDDVMVEEKKSPGDRKPAAVPVVKNEKEPEKITSPQKIEPARLDTLKSILTELSAVAGIIRCFLMDGNGITIVSMGETSNNADLGRQSLAIFQSTNRSVDQMNQGKLQQILVTAESGHLLLVSFGDLVLNVLASSKINLGLLRLALDTAIKKFG